MAEESGESRSTTPAPPVGWWRRLRSMELKDVVELAVKLSAPLAVLVGGLVAHNFERSMSMTQLIAAREDADTKIRAEMFRAVTEKLVGSKDAELTPERRAMFGELLALNFHEHFELKPLLLDVDEALRGQIERTPAGSRERSSLEDRRLELVSVARRVRQRQTQMLIRPAESEEAPEAAGIAAPWRWFRSEGTVAHDLSGSIQMFSVRFGGRLPMAENDPRTPCDLGYQEVGQQVCVMEPIFQNAPDGKSAIALSVIDADWVKETFTVAVKPVRRFDAAAWPHTDQAGGGEQAPACTTSLADNSGRTASSTGGTVTFDVSWFDMPLTDNSQLWGGSRYAIYVDNVCKERTGAEVVRFGLMWFPRDFFPPRERPTNYREYREKLNLVSRP